MAEVMLYHTQARQVVPVYERFINCYPDLSGLAQATEENLHKTFVLHPHQVAIQVEKSGSQ